MDDIAKGAALAVWLALCGCTALLIVGGTVLTMNVINQKIMEIQGGR